MASSQKPPHPLQAQPSTDPSSSSSSNGVTSFPILWISILGILITGILLVCYYLFVIKCCMAWRDRRRPTLSSTFFFSTAVAADAIHNKGLDHRAIDSLPTLRFRSHATDVCLNGVHDYLNVCLNGAHDCVVCLNGFKDGELLRLLPSCKHSFHVDCIDTWLQTSHHCPLCRAGVATYNILTFSGDQVIHIDVHNDGEQSDGRESTKILKARKGESVGDECIDVRSKDEFSLSPLMEPIRRSFSMDSCCDRRLYLAVQEILKQIEQVDNGEASSSGGGGKVGRSFFSFGHGRSCRGAVLPVQFVEV